MTRHDRACAYCVASFAWLAVLALMPPWATQATFLASFVVWAPRGARHAYRFGRDRLRIPLLDRQEGQA